jgi:hypothetical protein
MEQFLRDCLASWGEVHAAGVQVRGDAHRPEPSIFLEDWTHRVITFSGSVTAARAAVGGGVAIPAGNLPAKDRRTVYVLSVVLLWLIVFGLPILALDPDLSPRAETVLGYDEAALIAFAAGYTFYVLGRIKDR